MAGNEDRISEKFKDRKRQEREYKKQLPGEDEPALPDPVEPIHNPDGDIGRNDPCPCGSGKKYKQCCLKKK